MLCLAAGLLLPGSDASAMGLGSQDQLLEADLLYITRDSDNHHLRCMELLQTLFQEHAELRDEVLWRLARSEKWLGDRSTDDPEKLAHYERAIVYAKEGVAANNDCTECHFWLGVAYGKIGQTRGVLKSLFMVGPIQQEMHEVLRLDPNHSGAHLVMGVLYRSLPWFAGGSVQKSIDELTRAVRLNGYNTIQYLELARSYIAAGNVQQGLATLDQLEHVAAEPYDPPQTRIDRDKAALLRRELTGS